VRTLFKTALAVASFVVIAMQSTVAQQPSQAGVVTGGNNATMDGVAVSSGATVFSGDLIKTGDEGRAQVQSATMQFVLGPNSSARFFRQGDRVIVELERGSVSYSAKGVSENLTLFAQDIKFVPKTTELAVGQVIIESRCEVKATATRSVLQATSGRETKVIETNKTYNVLSEIGVNYDDSWKPVLSDYPEYPRDAEYHHSHSHVACAPGIWQTNKPPVMAGAPGHFMLAVAIGAGVGTAIVVHKALESPDKP